MNNMNNMNFNNLNNNNMIMNNNINNNNMNMNNNINNNNINNDNNINNNIVDNNINQQGNIERGDKTLSFKIDSPDGDYRNINLTASTGLKVLITISKNKTIKELFQIYAQKLGIPKNILGNGIVFLYNAITLPIHDNRKINEVFPNDNCTITVIDQNGVIGAK
jgi:hypothetical protein